MQKTTGESEEEGKKRKGWQEKNIKAERHSRKKGERASLVSSRKNLSEMKHLARLLLPKAVLPPLMDQGACTGHGREQQKRVLNSKEITIFC